MSVRYWSGTSVSNRGYVGSVMAFSDGMSAYVVYLPIGTGSGPVALPSRIWQSWYHCAQVGAAGRWRR